MEVDAVQVEGAGHFQPAEVLAAIVRERDEDAAIRRFGGKFDGNGFPVLNRNGHGAAGRHVSGSCHDFSKDSHGFAPRQRQADGTMPVQATCKLVMSRFLEKFR